MSISDPLINLPDRAALEQLSRALWSRGTLRGAAVLVGAGVSRGGARLQSDDAQLPPLWFDLATEMARDLYGAQSANAPKDPLRLAEEFRIGLGDAALTDFLRRHIRDDALEPGQIHSDLLDLPWVDVLTTNYDTLLERAAKNARRGYDIVLTENDLAHAGSPRIIKLHGSLGDGASFVISEEDYRTYLDRQAAFVNTARQLFIENELCLLGFSGDDPNFLQWSGWVRDRLGGQARRIYLVGALNLPPVKRRLLEARGVAPIDLAPAVSDVRTDQRHAAAISLFLRHLKACRPAEPDDWKPTSFQTYQNLRGGKTGEWLRDFRDPQKVVEVLREALVVWRKDRQACPGWIVCPSDVRQHIRSGTSAAENLPLALDTLPIAERTDVLLELAWRHERGAELPLPWLVERMNAIATTEILVEIEPELIRTLARVLLGAARVASDGEALSARAACFEALRAPSDLPALIAHECCLFAFDRLDFAFVAENVGKIDGDDPVWGFRRAALLYWIGHGEKALQSIVMATRELRARTLRDPDSVALRSRLAWAKMLAEALRWEDDGHLIAELDGLDRFALRNYDPWDQLGKLRAAVDQGLRKRLEARQIEPRFDAGSYRDNSSSVHFSGGGNVTLVGELRHLAERAGLPLKTEDVNVLATNLVDALRLDFEPTAAWHTAMLSTKPSYSGAPVDIHLGRIPVARMDVEVVVELQRRVEGAISFWRAQAHDNAGGHRGVETLRLYIEVLSRLAARDDADAAKSHTRLALELATDARLRHWWLNEPIGNLLKRALGALPAKERGELSTELLRFPLAAERDVVDPSMDWYDPSSDAYNSVQRNNNEEIFDARVAVFLHHLASEGPSRREAFSRLLYLYQSEQLTTDQVASFAQLLWKGVPRDSNGLPEIPNILFHAFLAAPAPPDINARDRVYSQLFAPGSKAAPIHLVQAASSRAPYIEPSEADAVRLFDKVVAWRPEKLDPASVDLPFTERFRERDNRLVASILGIVAAPAIAQQDRTTERALAVLLFLDETHFLEALAALPVFYGLNVDIDSRIVNAFRQPLASGDRHCTFAAVDALDRWLRSTRTGLLQPFPSVLCDRVLRTFERGRIKGLAHLIYLMRRLVEENQYGAVELDRIVDVLDELRVTTAYGPPDGDTDVETDRAVSLPLIRAECVRLAHALERRGVTTEPVHAWCETAALDPLPEVRNAVDTLVIKAGNDGAERS